MAQPHDQPTSPVAATTETERLSIYLHSHPDQIGSYKILEPVGEGGMGVVYKAEQREPIRRIVALKLIKLGMDTKEVIARFEAERQALAVMDHPNVAKVHDAGATEQGRPYFVMEFVSGEPITNYCDKHKLTIKQRLELFAQVCEAVQHAHTKGIIHRDIKPTNVLVTLQDGKPVPKVIDFGVAKAISHRLTERTMFTTAGQLVGTPEYMSPEQAEMSGLDVDTRTDIYSRGVLLYELLTGALPFDPKSLRAAAHHEIQRMIREVDPPRPSTRLSGLGDSAREIAQRRQMRIDELTKQLKSELEWIPLKAMRKDRADRYRTAHELADDVCNYLTGKALLAAPESRMYRLRKFLKRNRGPVTAATLIVGAIMLGLIGTAAGFIRAERREKQFIAKLAELAASTNERAILQTSLGKLPDADALLRQAIDQSRRELGDDHRITLSLMSNLAYVLRQEGRLAEAEPLNREVLERRRRVLGEDDPETLYSINNLGVLLLNQHRLAEAESLLHEALKRSRRINGPDHSQTLTALNNMAMFLKLKGKLGEAEPLYRDALARRRRLLGDDDRETLISMNSLGALLRDQKRYSDAEPLLHEALARRRKRFGDEDAETIMSMHDVGVLFRAQGRLNQAEPLFREALELRRRVLGVDHPDTLGSLYTLARLLQQTSRGIEADPLYRELYQRASTAQIPRSQAAIYISRCGIFLIELRRYGEAEQPLREAYRRLCDAGQQKSAVNGEVVEALAVMCDKTGRPEEAAKWRAELVKPDAATRPGAELAVPSATQPD